MQDVQTCSLCHTPLILKQINLTSAVFICTDLKCPYPVNQEDCILVKRRLRDINKPLSVIRKELELKQIKKEVVRPPDSLRNSIESSVESSPSMVSEVDFPMQEIDDLLNSIDSIQQKPHSLLKKEPTGDLSPDFNMESILSEASSDSSKRKQLNSDNTHSLGDELNIVPISESQYQDMDNFLMDLLN